MTGANGGVSDFDTKREVYTTRDSRLFHLDSLCADLEADSPHGSIEAILAVHFGRGPCQRCSGSYGTELLAVLATVRRTTRPDPRAIPLDVAGDEVAAGPRATEEECVPYGTPEDPGDSRFGAQSAAGWGTYGYGINPDEFLGEPTDDDHDWGRGSGRFID